MDYMRAQPDKSFDLAIVDPPYGDACKLKGGSSSSGKHGWSGMQGKAELWNSEPEQDYFDELFRVSKNQIVWGANHFISKLPHDFSCFLIWDKGQRDFSLADGEMAWTSFKSAARFFNFARASSLKEGKIHPTQKPIKLYEWLLKNYSKPGQRIVDTHLGSGSSAIAAHNFGVDFVGCELDKDYYEAAVKRFNNAENQVSLFEAQPEIIQESLL